MGRSERLVRSLIVFALCGSLLGGNDGGDGSGDEANGNSGATFTRTARGGGGGGFSVLVAGVRITNLDVPAVALEGDVVHLRCDYEDEGDSSLYTLKWYKDEREFFRYQPGLAPKTEEEKDQGKGGGGGDGGGGDRGGDRGRGGDDETLEDNYCKDQHSHHIDGITVDCWVSTERDVVLLGVTRATSGEYQCEVIGEHPKFRKETRKARLTVFSEPLKQPMVTGVEESYTPQDTVSLTCTPANTQYLPTLSWRINGTPVPQGYLVHYADRRSLGLRFVARRDQFVRGATITASCWSSFGAHHTQVSHATLNNAHNSGTHGFYHNAGSASGGRGRLSGLVVVALAVVMVVMVMGRKQQN